MNYFQRAADKKDLRKVLLEKRRSSSQAIETTHGLTTQLKTLTSALRPKVVAGYLPYGTEPDVTSYLLWLVDNQVKVIMPVSQEDFTLSWVQWTPEKSRPGIFGFAEALGDPANLNEADLILVPALSATTSGERLGKGKGYYDRALKKVTSIKVAVVFDEEVLSFLPTDAHDEKVDYIATEKRLIRAG